MISHMGNKSCPIQYSYYLLRNYVVFVRCICLLGLKRRVVRTDPLGHKMDNPKPTVRPLDDRDQAKKKMHRDSSILGG